MIFRRRNTAVAPKVEVATVLRSLDDWEQLFADNPHFRDAHFIEQIARGIIAAGATEPLTGITIPPGQLQMSDNLREGLVYSSVNSRMRAVMLCIQWAIGNAVWSDTKIYATEAVTPFALRLRGIFPKFIGSEYIDKEDLRKTFFPILCEDLQRLSFPSDVFDIVTTNEVLEHVPSIEAALREIYRVLRPGGWHVGTAPFAMGQYESITKAKWEKGQILYLTEPEYHGNPVDQRGSLVFEVPGWDILDRAKAVGFKDAHVKYILSSNYASLSSDAGGIFVFCFQK